MAERGRAPIAARALAALLLPCLLSGACAPSGRESARRAAAAPAPGGRFVYPLRTEPATLNFVGATDLAGRTITRLIGDGLVDHDARLRPVPRLASSWDWSADGRVLTFHLRPGVRFHDGAPLTSADVRYTYERAADPDSQAVGVLAGFLPVERVESPDPLTVRVIYRRPYAPALDAWEIPILPRHLDRNEDFLRGPRHRAPVGSGPFRFVSWDPGRRITLAANPDYWNGRPGLDALVLEVIPSQETILQALLAGEVDVATLTPVQWQSRASDPGFARRFRIASWTPLFIYYIAWRGDGSNPFFSDPAVRRALTLALDREGYVRSVLRGLGRVADSPFHLGPAGDDPGAPAPLPHDPRRAAALLDAAGWRLDPRTGVRVRDGVPFRFTLLVYGAGEDHVQFSQVAQADLRRLGVDMMVQRLDWPALWDRLKTGRFEAALSGLAPGTDPDSLYAALHSSQIDGGQNYAAFRDAEVDAWLDAGRETLDPRRRAAVYDRVDQRIRDRQPYTYLFFPIVQAAVSRAFDGVEASPLGILDGFPGPARIHRAGEEGRR